MQLINILAPLIGFFLSDVNHFNGSCFAISADKATWENAKMTCESHMMQLASIHSLNENRLISNMMENENSTAWIGLRNYTGAKGLAWIDGTPVDFLNWASSEPNWNGNCVRVRARDDDWLDRQCSSTYNFVCKRPCNSMNSTAEC
ncbi:predicted protein [Nematostella vectensis]|uniref:C-type lectin domain-containing protein n=1 Tax=Nematostella vectensis TaxID=45351 RepID=A7RIS3_NEMVE|nr:predicted protein [Nematostella vectensis]|eukprot:XP_001640622.1 predicted protein [Nematostella vectensis]